jgi:hypothetical protein
MTCKKTGYSVELMSTIGSYQLLQGDLFMCPYCRAEVVTNMAKRPIAEYYEESYADLIKMAWMRGAIARAWATLGEKRQYDEKHEPVTK